jgi:hypothetical protein
VSRSFRLGLPQYPPRPAGVALALAVAATGLAACGDDEPKRRPAPKLTASQNKGIAAIGKEISEYCFKGGSVTNVRRDVETLVGAYRDHPTAVFEAPDGRRSTMRQVLTAVADQLESCGERTEARPLRQELRRAG